jgi:hypothetical protein
MRRMDWEELFGSSSVQMKERLKQIRASLKHNGLKGQANEEILAAWLTEYLPPSVSVCTGEVIDSLGGRSKQADVIVFDTAATPRFFTSNGIKVLPIEPVYAVFEVKAYLNKQQLASAFDNMLAVKELKKEAYFPTSLTANVFSQYGLSARRWPVQFFVFAFESDELETVYRHVEALNAKQPLYKRIDMVCVLDKGLIVNVGQEGLQPVPLPHTQLITKQTDKALLTFYALVAGLLAQASTEPVCIHPYLKHIQH